MLFRPSELAAIERGEARLAFRRWRRPRVRIGTRLRTGHGVIEIISLQQVAVDGLSEADAAAAGLDSLGTLLAFLSRKTEGEVYRIGLRHAGPDPRIALRERAAIEPAEEADLLSTLSRMNPAAPGIGWPQAYLEMIGGSPGVRAAELAESLGLETQAFKRRVRRLKELGLTESLRPGYRLSPRGRALLAALHNGRKRP